MKKIFVIISLTVAILVTVIGVTSTQAFIDPGACANTGGDICDRQNDAEIQPLVKTVIDILLYVAAVIAIIFMILGGLKLLTSAGDAGKAASGRNTVVYAAIGILVTILAYAIVQFAFSWIIGQ